MKAALFHGPGDIRVEEINNPIPKEEEVLIKVKACAICGTDIRIYKNGHSAVNPPHIIGHEISGVVESFGKGVKDLKVGNNVAVTTEIGCGYCKFCLDGKVNLCNINIRAIGYYYQGGFAEYILIPPEAVGQGNIIKLEKSIDLDEMSLIGPLACVINSHELMEIKLGDTVLIMGAGPIGLLILQITKISGAFPICVIDIDNFRLEMAKSLGANEIVNVKDGKIEKVLEKSNAEKEYDFVFECTGIESVISNSVSLVKKGGTLAFIGLYDGNVPIRTKEIIDREIDVIGSYRYSNTYLNVIKLINSGILKVKPLISHIFNLAEIAKAFELADKREENYLKIIIRMN